MFFGDTAAVSAVEMKSAKKTKVHSHEAAALTATATATSNRALFLQAGTTYSMAPHANGGSYTLRAMIGHETVAVTTRPEWRAVNLATTEFVENYADLFELSNPKAAITFAGDEEHTSLSSLDDGPFIYCCAIPTTDYENRFVVGG